MAGNLIYFFNPDVQPVYQPQSHNEVALWVCHSVPLTESTWIPSKMKLWHVLWMHPCSQEKDKLELESCERLRPEKAAPALPGGFLWFKASEFGWDSKHERAVFTFTWCHLAGFLGIDISQKLPLTRVWSCQYVKFRNIAFWKMNLISYLKVLDYNHVIYNSYQSNLVISRKSIIFLKVPFLII